MPAEIKMPQQTDTMTEGVVVKWLKKEGESIKSGETIAEIETDKATMEMESFDGGVVAAILVPEGKKVPVDTLLAVVAKSGEKPEDVKQNIPPVRRRLRPRRKNRQLRRQLRLHPSLRPECRSFRSPFRLPRRLWLPRANATIGTSSSSAAVPAATRPPFAPDN